ncbi:PTS sugar transporter subunit IIB [Dorea sp. OM02-2LB]|nr:PTS sugar transporter subunit IIB [Dorea sp. OM02-2LB]
MEQITEHRIRRIMCCCGNGLGTSLFMQMTMEEALEKLNVSGVEVCFGSLADAMEGQADLFVVSEELECTLAGLPVLGLKDLSDADRAAKLLREKFGM